MKLLQIHAEFKLSDDFDGTLSDALREMADYCESNAAAGREKIGEPDEDMAMSVYDWQVTAIGQLKDLNDKDGTRAVFNEFHGEWPQKELETEQ